MHIIEYEWQLPMETLNNPEIMFKLYYCNIIIIITKTLITNEIGIGIYNDGLHIIG